MTRPADDPPFQPVDIIESELAVGSDTQTVRISESVPLFASYDTLATGNLSATVRLTVGETEVLPTGISGSGRYSFPLTLVGGEIVQLDVATARSSYTIRVEAPRPLQLIYMPDSQRIYFQRPNDFVNSDTLGIVWNPPVSTPFAYLIMAIADTTDTLIMSPMTEEEWKKYLQKREDAVRNGTTLPDTMKIPRRTRMVLRNSDYPAMLIPWMLFHYQGAYTVTFATIDSNYFNFQFSLLTRPEPTIEPLMNIPGEARGLVAAYAPVRFRVNVARWPE